MTIEIEAGASQCHFSIRGRTAHFVFWGARNTVLGTWVEGFPRR